MLTDLQKRLAKRYIVDYVDLRDLWLVEKMLEPKNGKIYFDETTFDFTNYNRGNRNQKWAFDKALKEQDVVLHEIRELSGKISKELNTGIELEKITNTFTQQITTLFISRNTPQEVQQYFIDKVFKELQMLRD